MRHLLRLHLTTSMTDEPIRLRVAGIGHDMQLAANKTSTVSDIIAKISLETKVPPPYLLLIHRGKKLTDSSATLSDLKIKDRTRLMLLHGPEYSNDKAGVEELQEINKELDELEANSHLEAEVIEELITRACIKLDNIEVSGSDTLRSLRREALNRAHEIGDKRTGCS